MRKLYTGSIYVVAASKDGKTEYWAAATSPKEATAAVQLVVGPAWKIKFINHRLTPAEVAELSLQPDDVRRLSALP
jgi:hypothetical protein